MGRKAESAQLEKEKEIIRKNNSEGKKKRVARYLMQPSRSFSLIPLALLLQRANMAEL